MSNETPNGANSFEKKPSQKKKPYYKKRNKPNKPKTNATEMDTVSATKSQDNDIDTATDDIEITEPLEQNNKMPDPVPQIEVEIKTDDTKYIGVVGIRFKPNGKIYYFDKGDFELKNGSFVIVETARGPEFGEVVFGNKQIPETSVVPPLKPILREANEADRIHNEENRKKEAEAFDLCLEKITKHGLDMKLVEAQYTFDNSKLLFYFTSMGRVDFRELVKDLASVFKTRIELRQIGIRDEAKMLGGIGACGRPLCCNKFLSDFVQVSIKMAKEQNLSLNSGKISGCCGRLMCCLQYEYSTYLAEGELTPPVDAVVNTPDGVAVVCESNPLAGTIKIKLKSQPDMVPKTFRREDVKVISKPQKEEADG